MSEHGVVHESWGPFAEGKNGLFTDPTLSRIGQAHGKSVAQVVLLWMVQRGVVVIPKSVKRERMQQNFDIVDFELSAEEMQRIAQLDGGQSLFFDHRDPARVTWLNGRRATAEGLPRGSTHRDRVTPGLTRVGSPQRSAARGGLLPGCQVRWGWLGCRASPIGWLTSSC